MRLDLSLHVLISPLPPPLDELVKELRLRFSAAPKVLEGPAGNR